MAIYITRDYKRKEILLFDDQNDPYQLNNIADKPESRKIIKQLTKRMGQILYEIEDPWATEGILAKVAVKWLLNKT